MKNIPISKEQAIEAMKAGQKVAHRYFSPNEWVKMEGDLNIINQDGCSIPVEEFWKFRYRKEFLTDWYILEDIPAEELHIKGEYAVGNGGQTYKSNGGYDIALIVNDGNVPTCLGFIWGETKEQAKANAQRIVTCVNGWDKLQADTKMFEDKYNEALKDGSKYAVMNAVLEADNDSLVNALEELIPLAQAIFDHSQSLDEDAAYEAKIKAAKDLLYNIKISKK